MACPRSMGMCPPDEDLPQSHPPEDEPLVEAEDIGCACNDAGIESEWVWHPEQGVYICGGCGAVQ